MPTTATAEPAFRTRTEFAVLRALALQVRLLTADQVSRGWFASSGKVVRKALDCLAQLEQAELIERRIVESHPPIPLKGPLLRWAPGKAAPTAKQFEQLSSALRSRWNKPHVALEVFIASPRSSRLFGAFVDARNLKHCEAAHDLHLSEIYLKYLQADPHIADAWTGEAAFPKLGLEIKHTKDPDAFLLDSQGKAKRIIEFAGSYDAEHLRAFHEHCAGAAAAKLARHFAPSGSPLAELYSTGGTAYELW